MRRPVIVLAAAMALAPMAASAQVCQGSFDVSIAPMSVGGQLGFHDGANSYGAFFGLQTRSNWFGQAGIGQLSPDGGDDVTVFALRGGRELTGLSLAQGKVKMCPAGLFEYADGDGYSSSLLKAGVSLGGELTKTPQVSMRPFAGASLARVGFEAGGFDDDEIGLMLDLGFGFVINQRWSIVPSLNLPLGMDFVDESFYINVAYAFGKR